MDKKGGTRKVFRSPSRRKMIFLYCFLGNFVLSSGRWRSFWDRHCWNHLAIISSSNTQVRFTAVTENVPPWSSCVVSIKVRRDTEMLNPLYCLFTSCIFIHTLQLWTVLSLCTFAPGNIICSQRLTWLLHAGTLSCYFKPRPLPYAPDSRPVASLPSHPGCVRAHPNLQTQ